MAQQVVSAVSKEMVDAYIKSCKDSVGWDLVEDNKLVCSRSYNLLFRSITNFMAKVKDVKSGAVGFIAEDPMQNFAFGAIVEVHSNEDPDLPGNFSYVFTFDPEDLKDCKVVYKMSGNEFKEVAIDTAVHEYGYQFKTTGETDAIEQTRSIITQLLTNAAKCIRQWVEENSVAPEPRVTEIKNVVVIEAMLDETGMKVFAITPSGELKNVIKNDAALESKQEAEAAA